MVLSLCGAFSVISATPSSRTSYSTSLSKTADANAGIRPMVPLSVARAALAISDAERRARRVVVLSNNVARGQQQQVEQTTACGRCKLLGGPVTQRCASRAATSGLG
eukprot:scaffold110709_cov60-Phaeocystis_antarctica.AAC.3